MYTCGTNRESADIVRDPPNSSQYDQTEYDQTLVDHLILDLSILYGYLKQKYRTFESRLDDMHRAHDKFGQSLCCKSLIFQFLNK